jgi:hypothetical protein
MHLLSSATDVRFFLKLYDLPSLLILNALEKVFTLKPCALKSFMC